MRLNGIQAEPGTVIGYSIKDQRFLSVESSGEDVTSIYGELESRPFVTLRFSTPEELTAIGTRAPRSVTEHYGIPSRMTPYGPVKMYGPRPRVKPKVITKREAKRILAYGSRFNPEIINGDDSR